MWLLLTVSLPIHLLLVFESWEGRCFWRRCWGLFMFLSTFCSGQSHWHKLLNLPSHLLLVYSQRPEPHVAILVCVWGLLWKVNWRYSSLVFLPPTNVSSMCGVATVRGWILVFLLKVVALCFTDSWRSAGQSLERLANSTSSFPVLLSWDCSVAITGFCVWTPSGDDVWLAPSIYCLFSHTLSRLVSFNCRVITNFTKLVFTGRCLQRLLADNLGVWREFFFWRSPVCPIQIRSDYDDFKNWIFFLS